MGKLKNTNVTKAKKGLQQIIPINNKQKKENTLVYLLISVFVTGLVYLISLDNGWIKNWDDGGYVIEHKLIHQLSWENFKEIFSIFYKGNYHPLTTLFYALEYSIVGEKAFLYHLNNLLFHLFNVALVFIFTNLLIKKKEVAFITALLFGIHPMHVESVAWISERKDVLYSFFFLLSMIYYFYFITKKEKKTFHYLISIVAFLFSSLSKSAAVTLPVVLLLMDYYLKRKWEWKILIEKIPFLFIAFVFGILAILSQDSAGAIQNLTPLYTWYERPMLACYALLIYLYKLIVPINLSAMYPYPERVGGYLKTIVYIAPFIIMILAYLVYISRKYGREIIFGTFFFLVTISLVLQILPVGGAIISERYTYIPYIGLFIIIGKGFTYSQQIKLKGTSFLNSFFLFLLIVGSIIFSVLTFNRIQLWKDGEILFTDVIKKYPNLPFAYNNRGYLYYNFIKDYNKVLKDYNTCLKIDSTFHRAWSNRGVLYYNTGKPDSAVLDFTKALKFSPNNTDALIGRANSYSTIKKFDLALPDYNLYIKLDQKNAKAYLWRATALFNLKKYDEALNDVNKCIQMTPTDDNAFLWRGLIYNNQKKYELALADFNQSIKINPAQFDAYTWRGLVKYHLNMLQDAISDYTIAINKNAKDAPTYINRSKAYYDLKQYELAFKDYCSAGDLRYALNKTYFFELKKLAGK